MEQWPLTQEKLEAAKNSIEREVQAGHLEPSVSPWNTPIFIIAKKDKKQWRLLHDLWAVNKQMEAMGALQPGLPLVSAIPADWSIIVIDIKGCFFSIPIAPEDRKRFAFTLPSVNQKAPAERWQWTVLPQGMKNSPVICQNYVAEAIASILASYPQAYISHYMDDILITTKTKEE